MTRRPPPLAACHECYPHVLAHMHTVAGQLGSALCTSLLSWSLQHEAGGVNPLPWAAAVHSLRRCLPAQRTSKPELNCKHEICMPCRVSRKPENDVSKYAMDLFIYLPARQRTDAAELPRSLLLQQSVPRTCCTPKDTEVLTVRV